MVTPTRSRSAVGIRLAERRDLDAIVALRRAMRHEERRAAGLASPDDGGELVETTRTQLSGRGQAFLLAIGPDGAVGVLRCALMRAEAPRYALLTTAFVRPEYRRQGILRDLVDAASRWCGERGVRDLRLRVYTANASADRAWAALGFTVTQVIRRRIEEA